MANFDWKNFKWSQLKVIPRDPEQVKQAIEDEAHFEYFFTRERYDIFAKFLMSEKDLRIQAEFMNFMTDDWGLRVYYPELPVLMFEYMKKLEFKQFDELSEEARKGVISFFTRMKNCDGASERDVTQEEIKELREFHAKWKLMPTL